MKIMFYVSLIIFIVTLYLVIKKPKNIGIGYSALAGAAVTFILGISSIEDIIRVWDIVWNATFTFISIIIISLILDEAGFFEYIAYKIVNFAGNSIKKLFLLIIVLGSVISAIFANDGTALILTPIVYSILYRSKFSNDKILPFIMATGFIADTASIPFTVSNLVNLVTAGYFNITFLRYTEIMIIPDLISIIASVAVLYIFYRSELKKNYAANTDIKPEDLIKDKRIFKISFPAILILITLYFISGFIKIPVSFISMPFAAFFYLMARLDKRIDANRVIKIAPWQIVLFSLGMYIIVFGVSNEGLNLIYVYVLQHINNVLPPFNFILSGFFFAFNAAIMNNLPSVMIGDIAISGLKNPGLLMYANVIGNDIGPKFTPIGSLATLLWLYTLERKNAIKISYRYYMKAGLILAVPVLFSTLLALYIVSRII
ncbi:MULTISPECIES: arsenical efflux pump membrane protein ArsB [unclassified Acidiplasma]|uniref:arsenical efflux pump membrane protein ArsB n=1 Tax=unclassified Acidiplasma TaxID=2641301 RepID=UPI0005E17693|nr:MULTISPECIES: arsenical efflux pump membrane protein ArsB [unclassified Acidiplasma]KJE48922.1 arsenical pump membrane protein [Acidiplasma sp. MBA-1]WMT54338.1 MAG: arsenical efflux pump membrane protein ArsB [Acidiplasma sp.]